MSERHRLSAAGAADDEPVPDTARSGQWRVAHEPRHFSVKHTLGTFRTNTNTNFTNLNTDVIGGQYSFSTTSANWWSSLGLGFSTTSANWWSSLGLGFSTTSSAYWLTTKTTANLAESGNLYYTDTRVNSYIHASTTIPKTYTSNTFGGTQTFNNLTINGTCTGCAGGAWSSSGTTGTAFNVAGFNAAGAAVYYATSTLYGAGGIPNSALANSTISGVALGGTLAALTATNSTLTFSGSYTGAAAATIGINLANANTWTALQTFANASSTLLGVTSQSWFGGTATSTIGTNGYYGFATTSPWSAITLDRISGSTPAATSSITVTEYQPATSTAGTIDARDSNSILWKLGASATTLTLQGFVPGKQVNVTVCNPGSAGGALTWASSPANLIRWPGGTLPTQTTTANKCDIWSFKATSGTSTMIILGAQSASF